MWSRRAAETALRLGFADYPPGVPSSDTTRELHGAIQAGDVDAVRTVLARGPSLEISLHLAVMYGHAEIVRLLLDAGADVHSRDRRNLSALHVASSIEPHVAAHAALDRIVPLLLEAGADPNADGGLDGQRWGSAIVFAARGSSRAVLDELVSHPGAELGGALDAALRSFEALPKVELLLDRGADPDGSAALIRATANTDRDALVQLLLARGARADMAEDDGCTALHIAASVGADGVVERLLAVGASPDASLRARRSSDDMRKGDTPRVVALRRVRYAQELAIDAIQRAIGGTRGDVATGQWPANLAGTWDAALAFYEGVGDEDAAEWIRDESLRVEVATGAGQSLATLKRHVRVLDLLGRSVEEGTAFGPGEWRVLDVEDSETGPASNLDAGSAIAPRASSSTPTRPSPGASRARACQARGRSVRAA